MLTFEHRGKKGNAVTMKIVTGIILVVSICDAYICYVKQILATLSDALNLASFFYEKANIIKRFKTINNFCKINLDSIQNALNPTQKEPAIT